MEIDLSLLHNNTVSSIDVSGHYNITSEYFDGTDIKKLDDVIVEGSIHRDEDYSINFVDHIRCTIEGKMVINDSISLDEIEYPYFIEYDDILEENCKKSENTLDIFQFLWENIVLEVPLQFTKVEDLSKFHGDGWRLISEEELKDTNNPFNELLKDFEKE